MENTVRFTYNKFVLPKIWILEVLQSDLVLRKQGIISLKKLERIFVYVEST